MNTIVLFLNIKYGFTLEFVYLNVILGKYNSVSLSYG